MSGPLPYECAHCGLPVPAGLVEPGEELQFCCSGCRLAYRVIHEHGLDGFYAVRERLSESSEPARFSGGKFAQFDDPTFAELYCRPAPGGMQTVELYLEGVHCAACVWLVEKVPTAIDGVVEVRLDLGRALARVTWDPSRVRLSAVARFLDSIGYAPHPYRAVVARDMARREDRALLIRIAVAGAIAGNVMLMAFALYGGHFHGMEDRWRDLFRWVSLLLAVPAVFWCARIFYAGALGALKTRTLHMDLPITIGILASFLDGAYNTVRGGGEVYFDSVTALIFLLLAGRFIQRRQQRAAADATALLHSLSPATARLAEGGEVREVPLEALRPGMHVELRAGDSAPADGVIVDGDSTMDRSLLTGESVPEAVAPGDPVHAGTTNLSGRLLVEVRSVGEETRLGRLMRLIEEGAARRAPVIRLADRISGWFVAAVLLLAAATVLIWLRLDPAHAVEHAVALLIVSCPCALGLATPLAVAAAVGRAARSGVLIKGGDALEQLARPGTMILDKTGTLTEGRLALVRWEGDPSVGPAVAALEAASAHPIARALAGGLPADPSLEAREVEQIAGAGIAGTVGGRRLLVAAPDHVVRTVGPLPPALAGAVDGCVADGLSPVVVAADGAPAAVAGLGDPVRPEARSVLGEIGARGWRLRVLSGDHPGIVAGVLRAVGLDAALGRGAVDPEEKVEAVRRLTAAPPVVMVGDGVNDAAALAAATVGIGVHGGAEAALAAADVFLSEPGLRPLLRLLDGARRTMSVIRRNLAFSLTYNVVAVSVAMAGLMSPLLAAVLMPASSITVVVSSYRAKTFE